MSPLYLLYRGPLSSCNYDCSYCPFAKHRSPPEELEADARGLRRFVDWIAASDERQHAVLFTPWGEGLVRPWYPLAMIQLSHLPQVDRVAIQTNLSADLGWVDAADPEKLAFWATYHPSEVRLERFLARCRALHDRGLRFSVGAVGTPETLGPIEQLRAALPRDVYLWVNAYKSAGPPSDALRQAFTAIDPLYPINAERHPSKGEPCEAGHTALSVDGEGWVRRCHFVPEILGNLYEDPLEAMLRPRPCSNATCGCHIGYVHLPRLGLRARFGAGLMERIPVEYGG